VATAKANPYAYLKCLFTELPKATTCDEVDALLPIAENRERFSRPPEPCHSTSSSAAGVWFTAAYCSARNDRRSIAPDKALRMLFPSQIVDAEQARYFMEQLGMYPPGTLVPLQDGEMGVVSSRKGVQHGICALPRYRRCHPCRTGNPRSAA
jgi:hypothetical protein